MERVELTTEIKEVVHMTVSEKTDKLIKAEIKAGYKALEFTCPKCGRWIAMAVGRKTEQGYYEILRSACSSDYEGIDQPCRMCNSIYSGGKK